MQPINAEAEYKEIIEVLKENGGEMDYKALKDVLADRFEEIRLRLKIMKEKGLVSFKEVVPSFSSKITLI